MQSLLPLAQRGMRGRCRHRATRYVLKWGASAHFLAICCCFQATRYEDEELAANNVVSAANLLLLLL